MQSRRNTMRLAVLCGLVVGLVGVIVRPALADDSEADRIERAFSEDAFRRRDTNEDGKLTLEEFLFNAKTPSLITERRLMFQKVDRNKDGIVTRNEAAQLRADGKLGLDDANPATNVRVGDEQLENIEDAFSAESIRKRDVNSDGKLTEQEFIYNARSVQLIAHRKKMFGLADLNRDGLVTREEVRELLATGIARPEYLPLVEDVFAARDRDNDGRLSRAEFIGAATGKVADRALAVFLRIDANKDSYVSRSELDHAIAGGPALPDAPGTPGTPGSAAATVPTPTPAPPSVPGTVTAPPPAPAPANPTTPATTPATTASAKSAAPVEWKTNFNRLDRNLDGKLSLQEVQGSQQGAEAQATAKLFNEFDKDKDGFLSSQEVGR